jgi:hypothetical protein
MQDPEISGKKKSMQFLSDKKKYLPFEASCRLHTDTGHPFLVGVYSNA